MIALAGSDLADHAAIHDAERADAHAFIADTNAAVAEDTSRRIEEHDRRKLLFVDVVLHFREPALAGAVREHHVLQFALAALVADRAIERMIGQQQLEHRFASLLDDGGIGADDHAFADREGTCGLKLRHLLDFHQAHAARRLQR